MSASGQGVMYESKGGGGGGGGGGGQVSDHLTTSLQA